MTLIRSPKLQIKGASSKGLRRPQEKDGSDGSCCHPISSLGCCLICVLSGVDNPVFFFGNFFLTRL